MTDKNESEKFSDDEKLEDEKKISAKEASEVEKLDDDSIRWRAKYKMSKSQYEEYKLSTENEKKELLGKFENAQNKERVMQDKLIDAKLEAHAVAAGIKDIELVKLIDKSSLKLNEQGEVEGLADAINAFKTRKPDFFGSEKKVSSSSNATFGNSGDTKVTKTDARSLTNDDWKKNKAKYMSGNFG